jgi:NADH-quinone oxidoreductase subunit A
VGQFLPILALMVLVAAFAGISFLASRILNPRRPTVAKVAPYECGIVDQTDPPERFPVRFFLIAMIFIVFDIEIIFFYPFTMVFSELGGYGLAAIAIFSVAVFESFLYLISKGALDWGPMQHLRPSTLVTSTDRTSSTTIRRVGMDGRASGREDVDTGAAA